MNLFLSQRKPYFWSQFLLGILAILSLPIDATLQQKAQLNQTEYNQTYPSLAVSEQKQAQTIQFYQQQQKQIQQPVTPDLLQRQSNYSLPLSILYFHTIAPIRAGPIFYLLFNSI